MGKEKISIIFCQSSIKVSTTLVCYEQERLIGNKVFIVVRNVESTYKFLKSLNLDASVIWFDNHLTSKRWYLKPITINNKVKEDIYSLKISKNEIDHVFFTSLCDDLLMGCYLRQFDRKSIVKLQGRADILNGIDSYVLPRNSYPIKLKFLCLVFSIILRYRFRIQTVATPVFAIDIGYYRYPFFDGSDMGVCERYKYQLSGYSKRKALVYASEYTDFYRNREDYVNSFVTSIKYLQRKGYDVYVKGHPRLGTLREALDIADFEIPAYVPAEFLDYSNFSLSIGLTTAALCYAASKIKSYSILPLTSMIYDERYTGWCNYLDKTSNYRVLYPKTWEEIE